MTQQLLCGVHGLLVCLCDLLVALFFAFARVQIKNEVMDT